MKKSKQNSVRVSHDVYYEYGEVICTRCGKRWDDDEPEPSCLDRQEYASKQIENLRSKLK